MPMWKIHQIDSLINQDKYSLAKEVLKQLENTEELKNEEKLELLQTKAKLFSKTLETEEVLKIREQINNLLDLETTKIEQIPQVPLELTSNLKDILWEKNISDIANAVSKKIKFNVSIQILNSLIERLKLNKQENDKIEKINIWVMYFKEIQILKELWETGEAYFYESLYFKLRWDFKKEKEFIEKSALEWNRDSINTHLTNIENDFLEKYTKLKTEDEKINYKQENLLKFEKEYKKFINWWFVNIIKKEISPRNPDLYEDLWKFFEKIWEYKKALEQYINWINIHYKWYHKLFLNIALLYKNTKVKSKDNKKSEYYYLKNFYEHSADVWDEKSMAIALEYFWDLEKFSNEEQSKKYYKNAIQTYLWYFQTIAEQGNQIENTEEDLLNLVRLFDKTQKQILRIWDLDSYVLDFITQLINLDTKYFLLQAQFFEKNWELFNALNSYLGNYELHKNKNSLNALLMFLETSLYNKKEQEIWNFREEMFDKKSDKEIEILEKNIEFLEIEKISLKKIIEIISKDKKVTKEDIAFFFELTLDKNFYENLSFNQVNYFIQEYNAGSLNLDIYLVAILKQIEFLFWYDKEILKPYIEKIEHYRKSGFKEFQPLDIFDKNDLKDILENSFQNIEKYNELIEK